MDSNTKQNELKEKYNNAFDVRERGKRGKRRKRERERGYSFKVIIMCHQIGER